MTSRQSFNGVVEIESTCGSLSAVWNLDHSLDNLSELCYEIERRNMTIMQMKLGSNITQPSFNSGNYKLINILLTHNIR